MEREIIVCYPYFKVYVHINNNNNILYFYSIFIFRNIVERISTVKNINNHIHFNTTNLPERY